MQCDSDVGLPFAGRQAQVLGHHGLSSRVERSYRRPSSRFSLRRTRCCVKHAVGNDRRGQSEGPMGGHRPSDSVPDDLHFIHRYGSKLIKQPSNASRHRSLLSIRDKVNSCDERVALHWSVEERFEFVWHAAMMHPGSRLVDPAASLGIAGIKSNEHAATSFRRTKLYGCGSGQVTERLSKGCSCRF
jgi:hypothetical protein